MHAFDILGDPARQRVLELLADGVRTPGAITDAIRAEFGLSRPSVSLHLRGPGQACSSEPNWRRVTQSAEFSTDADNTDPSAEGT